ncbi:MAG TPA: NifB/NifX family molybdenum-iron cluster-binding protein [Anaerolineales bacterium]|nr:NifB/NifX family molybdenum-iron cluster-binding protein [Anaerolineales bacterium]
MKIAVITNGSDTISQHFGRATHYLVATIENDQIINRELREKINHYQLQDVPHDHDQPGQKHGMGKQSHEKHLQMTEPIQDCEVLICRGMGLGAFESVKTRGIRPILTDIKMVDDALQAFIKGELVNRVDLLH